MGMRRRTLLMLARLASLQFAALSLAHQCLAMPVNLLTPDPRTLLPVPGVRIGVAMAGVRKAKRRDLVVFALDEGSVVAGVFTLNRFCAAPVQVCREHLAGGTGIRALLINTGNATGQDIETLGETVRERVKANSGIELHWEIKRIGIPL